MARLTASAAALLALAVLCLLPCARAQPVAGDGGVARRTAQYRVVVQILSSIVDEAVLEYARSEEVPPSPEPAMLGSPRGDPDVRVTPRPSPVPARTPDFALPPSDDPVSYDLPIVPYQVTELPAESGQADSAVVVLHGIGNGPQDMLPLVEAVRKHSRLPNTKFLIPQAETRFVTLYNQTMPSWFDILSAEMDGPQDEPSVVEAAQSVANMGLLEERVYGIDRSRIAVLGFSQGAALGLTTYMRHKWAAVVSLSGYLPIASTYPEAMTDLSQRAECLMIHGDQDSTVPVEAARLSNEIMTGLGRNMTYVELAGEGHGLEGALELIVEKTSYALQKALA